MHLASRQRSRPPAQLGAHARRGAASPVARAPRWRREAVQPPLPRSPPPFLAAAGAGELAGAGEPACACCAGGPPGPPPEAPDWKDCLRSFSPFLKRLLNMLSLLRVESAGESAPPKMLRRKDLMAAAGGAARAKAFAAADRRGEAFRPKKGQRRYVWSQNINFNK